VYDVTKFLEDHPGGDDVLLSATDSATIPSKVEYKPPKQDHYNQDKTSEFIIKILQFLVPLVILGVAVGIRIYTKSV
nr:cytochrome b5 [Tanacetum cinerariifolium]